MKMKGNFISLISHGIEAILVPKKVILIEKELIK